MQKKINEVLNTLANALIKKLYSDNYSIEEKRGIELSLDLVEELKDDCFECKGVYMSDESPCNQCYWCKHFRGDSKDAETPPLGATPLSCSKHKK